MGADGDCYGCIQAINKLTGTPFDEEDIKLVEAFASQAQISIQNSNKYTSLQELKKFLESQIESEADATTLLFNENKNLTSTSAKVLKFIFVALALFVILFLSVDTVIVAGWSY